jgi:hypothetical protein
MGRLYNASHDRRDRKALRLTGHSKNTPPTENTAPP